MGGSGAGTTGFSPSAMSGISSELSSLMGMFNAQGNSNAFMQGQQSAGTAPPTQMPQAGAGMNQMMQQFGTQAQAAQQQSQQNTSQLLQGQNLFNNLYQQSGNGMGQQQFGAGMNFNNPNGYAMMGRMTGDPTQNQQNYNAMAAYYNATYPSQQQ